MGIQGLLQQQQQKFRGKNIPGCRENGKKEQHKTALEN